MWEKGSCPTPEEPFTTPRERSKPFMRMYSRRRAASTAAILGVLLSGPIVGAAGELDQRCGVREWIILIVN